MKRAVFLTAALAFAVYLLTVAPDVTWAHEGSDAGDLITAAVTLGVPHPPGYPTYTLLGKLFSLLPVATVAFRFNLFSAISAALAAGVAAAATGHWLRESTATQNAATVLIPIAAGLTLAFMPLTWSQALIAEVYALNLLFVALVVWSLLSSRPPWLTGLLFGLSITTHLTSLLLAPLVLAWTPPRRWSQISVGFLAGLLPFLVLPLLALGESPVVWGRPETLGGWWWLVTGQLYGGNVLALPRAEWGQRLLLWSRELFAQFAWIGLPLVAVAISETWPERQRRLAPLLLSAGLYLVYAFGYRNDDAFVYLLPALLLLVLPLANIMLRSSWLAFLLPMLLLMLNFQRVGLRDDFVAGRFEARAAAEAVLAEAPPDALLLTDGDRTTFTLWYMHFVEAQRPDLIVADVNLFAFDWYRTRLSRHYHEPDLRAATAYERLAAGEWPDRTVCRTVLAPEPEQTFLLTCASNTPSAEG